MGDPWILLIKTSVFKIQNRPLVDGMCIGLHIYTRQTTATIIETSIRHCW